jgi:tetratricopeptide (TPR) repeat protein
VIGAFVVVYDQFLKPDPVVTARYNREMQVDEALARQDLPAALIVVNQAIDLGGNTTPMLLLRGVLGTIMGQTEQAGLDFRTAETQFDDRSAFLTARSEAWLKAGQFDSALQDASDAIRLDPSSVQALFFYGKANELKQNYTVALDAYKKASDLAEQQGKSELNATIRITMAMLMQSSMAQMPTAIETTPSR